MTTSIASELGRLIRASRATEVSIAACDLGSGDEFSLDADRPFHPASVFKLCVMMEVFRQDHAGTLPLDGPVLIRDRFASIVDGSPYTLYARDDSETGLYDHLGQSLPRRELVRRMIAMSSNLATNILVEEVTPKSTTRFMQELGAGDLLVRRGVEDNQAYRLGLNNVATARGLRHVLRQLAEGNVVSPAHSEAMIEILAGQQFNQMIPAALPQGVRVAHKTGWNADLHHDAGIIYSPAGGPIVLAILTKGYTEAEDAEAHALVASLARVIYDGWAGT